MGARGKGWWNGQLADATLTCLRGSRSERERVGIGMIAEDQTICVTFN